MIGLGLLPAVTSFNNTNLPKKWQKKIVDSGKFFSKRNFKKIDVFYLKTIYCNTIVAHSTFSQLLTFFVWFLKIQNREFRLFLSGFLFADSATFILIRFGRFRAEYDLVAPSRSMRLEEGQCRRKTGLRQNDESEESKELLQGRWDTQMLFLA